MLFPFFINNLPKVTGTETNAVFILVVPQCAADGTCTLRFLATVEHDGNVWGLPGGKIDPGEKPWKAVTRELKKKTGHHLNPAHYNRATAIEFTINGDTHVFCNLYTDPAIWKCKRFSRKGEIDAVELPRLNLFIKSVKSMKNTPRHKQISLVCGKHDHYLHTRMWRIGELFK
jgi:8-oxo-dGTP pyrophosphatase MutT (NUDIX family)